MVKGRTNAVIAALFGFVATIATFALINTNHRVVGQSAPAPCSVGNVFTIGSPVADPVDNPAEEFSWAGSVGDFSNPFDNPFVVGTSTTDSFPWNSRPGVYADDFTVQFSYDSLDAATAELTFGWSAGEAGDESKEVYLDGNLIGTANQTGANAPGWFRGEVVTDTMTTPLTNGLHELRFVQTSGDGTLWDYVSLDVTDCGTGEIRVHKIIDANADGWPQWGTEARPAGWTVNLYDITGGTWSYEGSTVTTGVPYGGSASFIVDATRDYALCEVQQDNYEQTFARNISGWVNWPDAGIANMSGDSTEAAECISVYGIEDGEVRSNVFGNAPYPTLRVTKYSDDNANRDRDNGEALVAGVTFRIYAVDSPTDWNTPAVEEIVSNGLSGANMASVQLEPGRYAVCEVLVDGWVPTDPAGVIGLYNYSGETDEAERCKWVNLTLGDIRTRRFGNMPVGAIQGRVFRDVNENYEFDPEERTAPGNPNRLDGWTVSLYDESWNLIDSMVTGDDSTAAGNVGQGQYRFVDLPLGTYYVCNEARSADWIQTRLNPTFNSEPAIEDPSNPGYYCYEISLGAAGDFVSGQRFGVIEFEETGVVLGDSTTNGNVGSSGTGGGNVLGASTLAETGDSALWTTIVGLSIIATSFTALQLRNKEQQ